MGATLRLLTDEQMRRFITEGFLILQTDFSPQFHANLLNQLNDVYEKEGNPGNNLLPRIRELRQVFDHPTVKGALTSVLGDNYMLHAHRHGHYNNSPKSGGWHKDSYWGYYRTRNIRPWWAMIMYFPQDTPLVLGPTGVMPGTQYYESRTFASDDNEAEAKASGQAGTFALIHYDIWHRSTANTAGLHRYMLKFEFMRTQAPTAPSWDNREREWVTPSPLGASLHEHEMIWRDSWNWLSGRAGLTGDADTAVPSIAAEPAQEATSSGKIGSLLEQLAGDDADLRVAAVDRLGRLGRVAAAEGAVPVLVQALADAYEPVALNAAYSLAGMGDSGCDALLAALHDGSLQASRSAAYGLAAAGKQAVPGLIAALGSEREETAVHAAFALGESAEHGTEAVPVLADLLLNPHRSAELRRAAVEALGSIGTAPGLSGTALATAVAALVESLRDEDVQVRFMTGLALVKLGAHAESAVPALVRALDDENRYVRAHAAEALHYIGSDSAKDALLDFLRNFRWCPSTTPESTFYP